MVCAVAGDLEAALAELVCSSNYAHLDYLVRRGLASCYVVFLMTCLGGIGRSCCCLSLRTGCSGRQPQHPALGLLGSSGSHVASCCGVCRRMLQSAGQEATAQHI